MLNLCFYLSFCYFILFFMVKPTKHVGGCTQNGRRFSSIHQRISLPFFAKTEAIILTLNKDYIPLFLSNPFI